MQPLNTQLRLDLEMAIVQVNLIAQKFGWHIEDMVRDGIANELLTCLIFSFIQRTEPTRHEIHGRVIVDILYEEDACPEFCVKWEPGAEQAGIEVEATLCHNFSAVLDRVLDLAKTASGCYWGTWIGTTPTAEGDAFRKRYGYQQCNQSGIHFVDRTKPITQPIQNSKADTVQMRVCVSDPFMDGKLG